MRDEPRAASERAGETAPTTAARVRGSGLAAVSLWVFGAAISLGSLGVLTAWLLQSEADGAGPERSQIAGLLLAAATGVAWILTGVACWRRRQGLVGVGLVVALISGGVAAWMIRT